MLALLLSCAISATTAPPTGDTSVGGSGAARTDPSGDTGASAPTGDTGTSDSAAVDTGIPPELQCPPEVARITEVVCATTTATLGGASTTLGPVDETVQGDVTEVGGVLVGAGTAVPGFEACGAPHLHQVRVVDDLGETWTIGWDLDGPVDDASADAVSVGAPVTLRVLSTFNGYSLDFAFVLSDGTGPLVLYESAGPQLSDAERGGVAVEVHQDSSCLRYEPGWGRAEHYLVTFTGPSTSVDLQSGGTGDLPLADRAMSLTLTGSYQYLDCADTCGASSWAEWETP